MFNTTNQRTLDELLVQLKNIVGIWHRGTRQGNDGNQGNTLEDLLGVPENNLSIPDFGVFEIKTQKIESGSLVTLFHKDPNPRPFGPLLLSLGWKHQQAGSKYPSNELSFRSTTPSNRFTNRGFSIRLTDQQIQLIFDPHKVSLDDQDSTGAYKTLRDWVDDVEKRSLHYSKVFPIFWDRLEFEEKCREKLDNTLFALCKTRTVNGAKEFLFSEAYILQGFNRERLPELFAQGHMYIDFDARTGHNHGTKLRVRTEKIRDLFDYSERIV